MNDDSGPTHAPPPPLRALPRTVIYKARFMVPLRALVRFKLFHLAAAAAAAGPAANAVAGTAMPGVEVALAAATVGACGGGAAALTWLSRRYVGELSLLKEKPLLLVSTLDGWGNRKDAAVPLSAVVPPLAGLDAATAAAAAASRPLLALDIEGGALAAGGDSRRQLLVSLTHAEFVDEGAMLRVLRGEPPATGD